MARKTNNAKTNKTNNTAAAQYVLDVEAVAKRGVEVATAATAVTAATGNAWACLRTIISEAQANGCGKEAAEAFFAAGDAVKGKKAGWWRGYKSAINNALALGITITNDIGYSALLQAIKEAKGPTDPAKLLAMVEKMAQGYLNAGGDKAKLLSVVKALEA